MTRRATLLGAAVVAVSLIVVGHVVLSNMDFGEAHSSDVHEDPEREFPNFLVSDPSLEIRTSHEIRARIIGVEDKSAVPGVQYVVVLSDGRWACGYTDKAGATHPLYAERPLTFEVYCCDEALRLWQTRALESRERLQTEPKKNCFRVKASESEAAVVFECQGW